MTENVNITIGEWVEDKVKEYVDLYYDLERYPNFKGRGHNIILGEIGLRKFQWAQVEDKFKEAMTYRGVEV